MLTNANVLKVNPAAVGLGSLQSDELFVLEAIASP
jgi:hypothetical protein